jgi:hypothetical protein
MSSTVSLKEAEPDFAYRWERRDSVPESVDRDLAGDGDRGRVEKFFHARSDKGGAEQVAVVFVGDHASPADVAVGVKVGSDDSFAEVDVDHPDVVSGAFGLVGGEAD